MKILFLTVFGACITSASWADLNPQIKFECKSVNSESLQISGVLYETGHPMAGLGAYQGFMQISDFSLPNPIPINVEPYWDTLTLRGTGRRMLIEEEYKLVTHSNLLVALGKKFTARLISSGLPAVNPERGNGDQKKETVLGDLVCSAYKF